MSALSRVETHGWGNARSWRFPVGEMRTSSCRSPVGEVSVEGSVSRESVLREMSVEELSGQGIVHIPDLQKVCSSKSSR